ncbi:hypothetical protein B5E84_19435, partial [Lachnoclostridium sp. An14]|uniref:hypothetical protein n=1 Tax=Lachnoclostridium sp. An14 TaxID=1965562 RepID=UPI000B38EDB5
MEYKPHNYQQFAINYILEHPIAAVILGMGLGKTHDKRTNEQIMNIRLFSGILKEKRMGCYERSVRFCKYGDG